MAGSPDPWIVVYQPAGTIGKYTPHSSNRDKQYLIERYSIQMRIPPETFIGKWMG